MSYSLAQANPPHIDFLSPYGSNVPAQKIDDAKTKSKAFSYLDGKVITHVFPNFEAAQEGRPVASTCRSVIIKVPPDSIQHADQPVASEHQVKEQEDAGGC